MTTALDTNVVIALWDKDATLSLAAQNALDAAFRRGTLVAALEEFHKLLGEARSAATATGIKDTSEICDCQSPAPHKMKIKAILDTGAFISGVF